jgi:hypothetical protein
MRTIRILLLAGAFGAGLYFVAWWTVPLVAALFALLYRGRTAPSDAMIGALVASLVLLAPRMLYPSFGTLLRQLGQIFPMPGVAVLLLGILLTMVLAFTAARVALGVVGTRSNA